MIHQINDCLYTPEEVVQIGREKCYLSIDLQNSHRVQESGGVQIISFFFLIKANSISPSM